jgi:CubicO group peptidase (beta-lactamase class C family)
MRSIPVVLASFLLVFAVGAAAVRGEGPPRPPDAPARTELRSTVNVPLGELGHLQTVRALVNESGPYRIAIDTGSSGVLRVSARLAKALALPQIGVVRTGDPSGRNAVEVPIVRVGSVTIGGATFGGIEASVGTRLGSLEPDGIIGLGLFSRVTVQLDYPKRRLRLSNLALPRRGAHIVALRRSTGGAPQIAVDAAGKTLWADVDSGGPALLTVPRRIRLPLLEKPRVVGRGRTAANEFEIRAARLAGELRVAGWTWRRPTIHIVDRLPTASIGAALLRRYAVTFDLPNGRLELARGAGPGRSAASGLAPGPDGVGSMQPSQTRPMSPRRQDWRAFAGWLRQRAKAGAFSGAVLVARDDKPVVKQASGLADRQRRRPNTVDTRFNIGSVGKTFTAVAIAQLVEAGKLSFDDPIGRYLPGFPREVANRVTVGQLLTHTSGLGDVFMRWHPNAPAQLDVSDLLTRIVREPLQFEPGSRFGYSNSGYVVLGAIIESVTGESYYDYVRRHVFVPAGMTRTGWYSPDQVPNMAHGYARVDTSGTWVAGNPSGGAYSTVGDLLKFARALLKGRLLSPKTTKTVLAGKVNTPKPGPAKARYGYGFEEEFRNGVRIVGNGGGQPGVEAQLRIFPRLGYTVIVLTNKEGANRPVQGRAFRLLTGAAGRS